MRAFDLSGADGRSLELSQKVIGGKVVIACYKAREQPGGMTFALRKSGCTLFCSNRYRGSNSAISPRFVCQRSFLP